MTSKSQLCWDLPSDPVVKTALPIMQRAWVQSQTKELKSPTCHVAKKYK